MDLGQESFTFARINGRLRPNETNAIRLTRDLRNRASALKERAAQGGYSSHELQEYWGILQVAPRVLISSPKALSERADLSGSYFGTAPRKQISPKLHTFFKALTAVVELANERLADVDGESPLREAQWVENPYEFSERERIQTDLVELVRHLKTSNALSDIPELDRAYRDQLVILLETAVVLLKAPLVEKGLLKRVGSALTSFAKLTLADSRTGFIAALSAAAATALMSAL